MRVKSRWYWDKWWHKIIRRRTYEHEWGGNTYLFIKGLFKSKWRMK